MTESQPSVSVGQVLFAQGELIRKTASLLNLPPEQAHKLPDGSPQLFGRWAVSVLGGGEAITAIPAGTEDRWIAEQQSVSLFAGKVEFGDDQVFDFRAGELAAEVNALYQSPDDVSRAHFATLSKCAARFVFTLGASGGPNMGGLYPQLAQTTLAPHPGGELKAYFPGDSDLRYSICNSTESLKRVVTFGPGLSGAVFGTNLAGFAEQVDFVSGGMGAEFVTEIIKTGMAASTHGIALMLADGRLEDILAQIGRQDIAMPSAEYHKNGIAASANRLSKGHKIDVTVMSSVHAAGIEECAAGVEIAADNMRAGGVFILKAPDVSLENEAGMDKVVPLAVKAFGAPAVAGACGVLQGFESQPMGTAAMPINRPASFAIFHKP